MRDSLRRLWVIGSGGHAKVVIDSARASGAFRVAGVLDDSERRWGETFLGVPIVGPASAEAAERLGVTLAFIAVGPNRDRAAIARRLGDATEWATIVHPSAILGAGATLGAGTLAAAGVVVQPDAVVGRHVILNTCSSIDHDARVGDFAHVAPGARLAGGVRIGAGVLLSLGCCVLPGVAVGPWATVGSGAVVIDDVPDGLTVMGVPARPARSRTASATS